jgi:AraC-like DNA-binding protein
MGKKMGRDDTPRRLLTHRFLSEALPFNIHPHTLDMPFELHWHEFFEMTYVWEGQGVNRINGLECPLEPGALFLLTPSDFHEIFGNERTPLQMVNVHFTERMIGEEVLNLIFQTTGSRRDGSRQFTLEPPLRQRIEDEIGVLLREFQRKEDGFASFLRATLERILLELLRLMRRHVRYPERNPFTGYKPAIRQALLFIHTHFRQPMSLESAAKEAGLTPAYFSTSFHHSTGIPFQKYIQELRLEFARSLLHGTSVSVTEICHGAGFSTLTHFEKIFKEKYGVSPKQYQQRSTQRSL